MKSRNISDDERQAILAKGDFKTVLERDDRYAEHRPIVVALVSVGTKYIHGIVCHRNDEGKLEPNYWVASFDRSKSQIFDGQRWDLVQKHDEYRAQRHGYQDRREKVSRELWWECETKARREYDAIMAKWDQENPAPKDPFSETESIEKNLAVGGQEFAEKN